MTLLNCVRISPKPSYAGRTSFRIEQCRTLYLMREIFAKGNTPIPGGSKITQLVPFNKLEDPKDHVIDLHYGVTRAHHSRRRMTLASALNVNINPGWALCLKETSESNEFTQCRMKLLISETLQTHALRRTGKGSLNSRIFRFSTQTSIHTFVEMMAIMWHHLSKRQAVEVQIQYHKKDFATSITDCTKDPFQKFFAENIHLRPDVILKAMPEKCGITISPQTDQKSVVAWVMGPPHVGKNKKVVSPVSHTEKLNKKRDLALQRLKEINDQVFNNNLERLVTGNMNAGEEPKQTAEGLIDEFHDHKQQLGALEKEMQERREARKALERQLKERSELRKKTNQDV